MTPWVLLAAGAGFALACAGELEGKPEDYVAAYGTGQQQQAQQQQQQQQAQQQQQQAQQQGNTGGTGSGGTGGGTIPPDPACVATVFTNNTCIGCHSMSLMLGGFDSTGSDLGKRFSAQVAVYKDVKNPANCDQGAKIIDPANPSRSVLLRKVKKMQSCGDPMPPSGSLSAGDLACIENWVNSFGSSANKLTLESGTGGNNF